MKETYYYLLFLQIMLSENVNPIIPAVNDPNYFIDMQIFNDRLCAMYASLSSQCYSSSSRLLMPTHQPTQGLSLQHLSRHLLILVTPDFWFLQAPLYLGTAI